MTVLIAGVWICRIGLLVCDTTMTQMMQEVIPQGSRGVRNIRNLH